MIPSSAPNPTARPPGSRGRVGAAPRDFPSAANFARMGSRWGVDLPEEQTSHSRECRCFSSPFHLPRPFFPFLPRFVPRLRRPFARGGAVPRLQKLHEFVGAAQRRVFLRQLPDSVSEFVSAGCPRPLRSLPQRPSWFRRSLLLRSLRRRAAGTHPPL